MNHITETAFTANKKNPVVFQNVVFASQMEYHNQEVICSHICHK
jgi:hypothetical protein